MAVPSLHKDHLPVSRISQESRFPKIAKPTPLCRAGSGESGHEARPERGLLPDRQGLLSRASGLASLPCPLTRRLLGRSDLGPAAPLSPGRESSAQGHRLEGYFQEGAGAAGAQRGAKAGHPHPVSEEPQADTPALTEAPQEFTGAGRKQGESLKSEDSVLAQVTVTHVLKSSHLHLKTATPPPRPEAAGQGTQPGRPYGKQPRSWEEAPAPSLLPPTSAGSSAQVGGAREHFWDASHRLWASPLPSISPGGGSRSLHLRLRGQIHRLQDSASNLGPACALPSRPARTMGPSTVPVPVPVLGLGQHGRQPARHVLRELRKATAGSVP